MVIKYPKCPENVPNGQKIINSFQSRALQNLPKLGIFGFENKPSGNPAAEVNEERSN
jgi:hypothetical protein